MRKLLPIFYKVLIILYGCFCSIVNFYSFQKLFFLDPGKSKVGSSVQFGNLVNNTKEITYDDFKKLKMVVKKEKVIFDKKTLKGGEKEVVVPKAQDGAKIC